MPGYSNFVSAVVKEIDVVDFKVIVQLEDGNEAYIPYDPENEQVFKLGKLEHSQDPIINPNDKIGNNLIGVKRTKKILETMVGMELMGEISKGEDGLVFDNAKYYDHLWNIFKDKYKIGDEIPISYADRQNPTSRCLFVDIENLYRASIVFNTMGYFQNYNEFLDELAFRNISDLMGIRKAKLHTVDTRNKRFILSLKDYIVDKEMEYEIFGIKNGQKFTGMIGSIEQPDDNHRNYALKVILSPANIVTIPVEYEIVKTIKESKIKAVDVLITTKPSKRKSVSTADLKNSGNDSKSIFAKFIALSNEQPNYFSTLMTTLVAKKVIVK